MKRSEVRNYIDERISINGRGDLAFEFDKKPFIYDKDGKYDIRLRQLTKGGLVEFEVDGKHRYVVPPENVNLFGQEPEPYNTGPINLSEWTVEPARDLPAQYGVDVEKELIDSLSKQL